MHRTIKRRTSDTYTYADTNQASHNVRDLDLCRVIVGSYEKFQSIFSPCNALNQSNVKLTPHANSLCARQRTCDGAIASLCTPINIVSKYPKLDGHANCARLLKNIFINRSTLNMRATLHGSDNTYYKTAHVMHHMSMHVIYFTGGEVAANLWSIRQYMYLSTLAVLPYILNHMRLYSHLY